LEIEAPARHKVLTLLVAGLLLLVSWQLLSTDVLTVITNDGVGYLAYAEDLRGYGLVHSGYRTVGYTLFLNVVSTLAGWVGLDTISMISITQRTILLCAVLVVVRYLRLWSIPILITLLHGDVVALSNFALTESLGLSATLICVVCLWLHVRAIDEQRVLPLIIAAVLTIYVVLLRSSYLPLTFLFVPIFFYHLLNRKGRWRGPVLIVSATGVLSLALLLSVSYENRREMGVFSPATGGARAAYYGTYQVVFRSDGARKRDDLAEFFDEGNVYRYIHHVDRLKIPYEEKAELLNSRAHEMLIHAERSRWFELLSAARYFGSGGRENDLSNLLKVQVIPGDPQKTLRLQLRNQTTPQIGVTEFLNRFNEGRTPVSIQTSAVLPSLTPFSLSAIYSLSLVVGFLICLGSCIRTTGIARYMALSVSCAYLTVCFMYAIHLIDIWRYTLVNFGLISVSAVFALQAMLRRTTSFTSE
jgi:hypothetical protein